MISNERQSTFLSKVKRIIVPEPFADPDQERSVDIFLTITLASLSGLGLVLANRLFRSDFECNRCLDQLVGFGRRDFRRDSARLALSDSGL